MSTFLNLVNDVERESGTIGHTQRLSTVVGAVGRQEKIVTWTALAWAMIQRARPDWTFMRAETSHALTAGTARYAASDLGVTDFGGWLREADGYSPYSLYDPTIGQGDESPLERVGYQPWSTTYDRGTHDAMRPTHLSVDFARKLCFGPTPDKAYVFRFGYRRAVQMLAADADEPIMPEEHHNAIVWYALTLLAEHDEAGFQAGAATLRWSNAYSAMVRDLTPEIEL